MEDFDLRLALRRAVPTGWLGNKDTEAAKKFADELEALQEECVREGGYSQASAQYLDRYRDLTGLNDKVREVFGRTVDL